MANANPNRQSPIANRNMKKTLLITDVSGFIGLRAAELAIAKGMQVRGMQVATDKSSTAKKLGVEVIPGSVTKAENAKKACQGIDIVLHTEELTQESGSLKDFRKINVDGTQNISNAAKEAGVKTFVHLSSGMVYGFNYPEGVTEDGRLTDENNPYCQTKIEAEQAILKLNSPPDFGVIVIRTGDVYGPGCIPWIVRPLHLMSQKLFAYVNDGEGVINHLYVDNLVDAIFLSLEKETYGEIFNVTDGENTSWKEYFMLLAETGDLPAPFSLPKDELKLFLKVRSGGQKLFRQQPDIFPEAVDFMSRPYSYSIDKAREKLTYKPAVSLKEGMCHIKQWLQTVDIQKIMGK